MSHNYVYEIYFTQESSNLMDFFQNYGKIKNISVRNVSNSNYVFVEFYKYEDAQNAVFEINKG